MTLDEARLRLAAAQARLDERPWRASPTMSATALAGSRSPGRRSTLAAVGHRQRSPWRATDTGRAGARPSWTARGGTGRPAAGAERRRSLRVSPDARAKALRRRLARSLQRRRRATTPPI